MASMADMHSDWWVVKSSDPKASLMAGSTLATKAINMRKSRSKGAAADSRM